MEREFFDLKDDVKIGYLRRHKAELGKKLTEDIAKFAEDVDQLPDVVKINIREPWAIEGTKIDWKKFIDVEIELKL